MGIELGLEIIKQAVIGWIPFGMEWAIFIILTTLTLLMLTRDPQKMKEIAFPIAIGWYVCGIGQGITIYLIMSILGIIFVLEHMSITQMGEIISAGSRILERATTTKGTKIFETYNTRLAKTREIKAEKEGEMIKRSMETPWERSKRLRNEEMSRRAFEKKWQNSEKRVWAERQEATNKENRERREAERVIKRSIWKSRDVTEGERILQDETIRNALRARGRENARRMQIKQMLGGYQGNAYEDIKQSFENRFGGEETRRNKGNYIQKNPWINRKQTNININRSRPITQYVGEVKERPYIKLSTLRKRIKRGNNKGENYY